MKNDEITQSPCEACGSYEFETRDDELYCVTCKEPVKPERRNAVNWFEIPVADMARALKFYEVILGAELTVHEGPGGEFAMLPAAGDGVGGALVKGSGYLPGTGGTLVYLNAGDDLREILGRIEVSGGKVLLPKTAIPPWGFIAHFVDSEGNRVGLHSPK